MIQSSLRLLIETKTERNAIRPEQITRHAARLNGATEATVLLLVLTPDEIRPPALDHLNDPRIVWTSFAAIDQAIDEMFLDKQEVVSEREAFLLRELQAMLAAEGLLASAKDVVIVAARNAWPEYNRFHAYVCQPNRSFQQVNRLGFYSKGVIYPLVPKILQSIDEVEFERDLYEGELGRLVNKLIDAELRTEGKKFKVLLLSTPESPDTLKLAQSIPNDKVSKTGKGTAFTMGQRYVATGELLAAKTTSDLD